MLIETPLIHLNYITLYEELVEALKIINQHNVAAVDTEVYPLCFKWGDKASALDPHTSRIRLVQINVPGNKVPWVIDIDKIENTEGLVEFFTSENITKIFFNSSYDIKQIRSTFGVWLKNSLCTRIAYSRLGLCTSFKKAQALGLSYVSMCRHLASVILDKDLSTSDWSSPQLTHEQLAYAALDVGAPLTHQDKYSSLLLDLHNQIVQALCSPYPQGYDCAEALELDQKVNFINSTIEYTGMPVNPLLLNKLIQGMEIAFEESKLKLVTDLSLPRVKKAVATDYGVMMQTVIPEEIEKLLNNPKKLVVEVNKALNKLGVKLDDVKASSLEKSLKLLSTNDEDEEASNSSEELDILEESLEISFGHNLIDNLITYKKLLKALGTNYKALINVNTGRMHSSIHCIGAATGRMSSGGKNSFNCQQIPTKSFVIEELAREKFYVN